MVTTAFVKIWNKEIGVIEWDSEKQTSRFQYTDKYLKGSHDLSPIHMPLKNGNRVYSSQLEHNNTISTFKGLPGLLADSLPDKYGNQLINLWLAQNGRPSDSMNPIEQLCFIGNRGMGALEYEPHQTTIKKKSFSVEINSLVDIAQKILHDKENFKVDLSKDEQEGILEVLQIGTSAGGMRPKALIAYNDKTKEVLSGQTNAPKNFDHWLLKLDGTHDDKLIESSNWGKVEYAYYLMAKECDIDMMECRLLEENGRAHFMTKRFDRESNTKHHIQSFCGIQHYDYNEIRSFSYEQLFETMRMLNLPLNEAHQMFKRMTFNVLANNCDDHTKNFSFRLKQNGKWRISPAYDICYSYRADSDWVNQHSLSINGKRKDINKDDLLAIARLNNINKGVAVDIISNIQTVVSNWLSYANKLTIPTELTNLINDNLIAYKFKI